MLIKENCENKLDHQFLIAEYSALRNEIVQRLSFQHQLVAITLVVAGTFISLGTQPSITSLIVGLYPLVAVCISAGWAQNNIRIKQLGDYIRQNIESKIFDGGWESHRIKNIAENSQHVARHAMSVIFGRGIFISTQLISFILFIARMHITNFNILILTVDVICIFFTVYLTRRAIL